MAAPQVHVAIAEVHAAAAPVAMPIAPAPRPPGGVAAHPNVPQVLRPVSLDVQRAAVNSDARALARVHEHRWTGQKRDEALAWSLACVNVIAACVRPALRLTGLDMDQAPRAHEQTLTRTRRFFEEERSLGLVCATSVGAKPPAVVNGLANALRASWDLARAQRLLDEFEALWSLAS